MPPKNEETTRSLESAWELDKKYGIRLDQAFQIGERFAVLAAVIETEIVETTFGDAQVASILCQKLDEQGRPTGIPFAANTLASSIVEKMQAAVETDFPAFVELMHVPSRKNGGKPALVLQWVGSPDVGALIDKFGQGALQKGDLLRPVSERIGL